MNNKKLIFISLITLIAANFVVTGATNTINQVNPSFISEPVDFEITANETLSLVWGLSNSDGSDYEIYITWDENTTLIGAGEIFDDSVTLDLDYLYFGEYEFAFKLIYSGGNSWSNVTITVTSISTETSEESSDDGFIPGYTILVMIMTYPIIILFRSKAFTKNEK